MAADRYYCPTSGALESSEHGGFGVCCDKPELHRPVTLEQLLDEALGDWCWEDRTGCDVIRLAKAEEVALKVFQRWLRSQAEKVQEQADLADGPTARTILIVKTDMIQQLAYAAAPDAD